MSKLIIGTREKLFEIPLIFWSLKECVVKILSCAGIYEYENHSQYRSWELFENSVGKNVSEAKLRRPFNINSFWVWIYDVISLEQKQLGYFSR